MKKAEEKIYSLLAFTDPDPARDREKGYLTELKGRSGRQILHYLDEANDTAVYVDTLEELTDQEREAEIY